MAGVRTKLQVAHIKLSHSRAFLIRAYLLQTHEMLFDAHWHGFRVFGGVPGRGIYDNTCLINFERNRYSVPASFANRPVSLRVYPDRLVVAAEGQILCEHPRFIERSHKQLPRTIYDWRHYLAVMRHDPASGAVIIMLRSLKMYGMAQASQLSAPWRRSASSAGPRGIQTRRQRHQAPRRSS